MRASGPLSAARTRPGGTEMAELRLPRARPGLAPQRLLVTLMGDYWYGRGEHLPSAALVALLGEFGIGEANARSALMRLTRRGLLEASQRGRRTFYGLTAEAEQVLREGVHHIFSFGRDPQPWSGRWTVVAFSVPEDRRDARHVLRTRLRWLGFAPLFDGLWVSARIEPDAASAALRDLGIDAGLTMLATVPQGSGLTPLAAWDLDGVRGEYDAFTARYEPIRRLCEDGAITTSDAFRARTQMMDDWRTFPNIDPDLPDKLIPGDWPRGRARAMFVLVYDQLGPLAEARYREIVRAFDPELAALASHHTSRHLPG